MGISRDGYYLSAVRDGYYLSAVRDGYYLSAVLLVFGTFVTPLKVSSVKGAAITA